MEGAALTLKAATNALHSASHKWYKIGVQLEVSTHVLKSIEQQYRDPGSCLTDLLDHWMRNATDPHPSWRDLIDALGAPSVGEKKLAGELEEKHCNQKEPVTHKMKESSIPGSVEKREANPLSSIDVSPERHLALRKRELKPESPKMEELRKQDGASCMRVKHVRGSETPFHASVLETKIATMALSKGSRCPNGVIKARKVSRCAAGSRSASGFVAAIDFGTTYCSVVYTLQQKSNEIHKLRIDGLHTRVPNAILIERKTNAVEAFGSHAQTRFSMMKKEVCEKYIYFERMKMILYRTQGVSRTTPISPVNSDEQYYLLDVVALILKYLRDRLYDCLRTMGLDMSKIQFDWVVTVPAIWDIRGKQMMREAAYKAGLCSSSPNCSLVPYSKFRKLERPVENAPDRLFLALEPEVAGLYCQNSHDKPRKHFTVLDIGGGVLNISSFHIDEEGHICVTDMANGNDWGGTRVNEKFSRFLETIVNDPDFRQYLNVSDVQLRQQHRADLNKLIYESFEQQKMIFGDEDNDDKRNPAHIFVPNSFGRFYGQKNLEKAINAKYRNIAKLDGLELTIEPQKMKEFFQPSIDQIRRYTFLALERVKQEVGKLEAIYLVGGFGGCKFIKKAIKSIMQDRYGLQLEVIVPDEHKLAAACGAVKFRHNPEIIWARKAELTYGDIICSPFDAGIHDPAYKMKSGEGKDYCKHLFRTFIEVGDTIFANEVLQTDSVTPFKSSMTHMTFTIYSSFQRNIWYARDKDGKLATGLKEVGRLVYDVRDIPGKFDDERVALTVDLSQAEIQFKAHHERTGKEVKVVLDCL